MARKSGKSINFDMAVKHFIEKYDIPTKKDIDKLSVRIERLEKLIKRTNQLSGKNRQVPMLEIGDGIVGSIGMTASDITLEVIKGSKKGAGFADIQAKTGFNDKKLRNIIFRLNKLGKIKRKQRGIYVAAK